MCLSVCYHHIAHLLIVSYVMYVCGLVYNLHVLEGIHIYIHAYTFVLLVVRMCMSAGYAGFGGRQWHF